MNMRPFDFSPLYRSAIGFDRLARTLDSVSRSEFTQPSYPPYNIQLTGENEYRISMAVAGFERSEIDVEVDQGVLKVVGRKNEDQDQTHYLYRGIAARTFERKFQLEDFVRVDGARIENGLLHIDLVRELPERMKPRKIAIQSGGRQLEGDQKANSSEPRLVGDQTDSNDSQAA